MAGALVLAFVLVAANGFFVAVEFSVARLRPTQAQELLRQGRPGAKSVAHAVDHIDAYLSACQLGITMASLGLGAVGDPVFHDLLEPVLGDAATIGGFGLASLVAFLVITTLHVVLGELSPKSLAIARTAPVVLALAPPMRTFYLATKPLVDLLNARLRRHARPGGDEAPGRDRLRPYDRLRPDDRAVRHRDGTDPVAALRAGRGSRVGTGRHQRQGPSAADLRGCAA